MASAGWKANQGAQKQEEVRAELGQQRWVSEAVKVARMICFLGERYGVLNTQNQQAGKWFKEPEAEGTRGGRTPGSQDCRRFMNSVHPSLTSPALVWLASGLHSIKTPAPILYQRCSWADSPQRKDRFMHSWLSCNI